MSDSKLCTTTCPYCGVGCGVEVTQTRTGTETRKAQSNGTVGSVTLSDLKGQSDHPANFGRLCVKGSNLLETNDLTNRLLHPMVNQKETSWDVATTQVAQRFLDIIEKHGPDAVAFYVSGQLLTEDYYVANKLMKGYIGSANIDTNSRLCMSSAVAGYKRAFGSDTVPCNYQDLEKTEYLVFVGSNAAWTHPVLFQRIERAKKLNPYMKIVVVDPRRTHTCAIADQHLAISPGTDAILFNGLLNYLNEGQNLDEAFINEYTEGFSAALQEAALTSIEEVATQCGVDYETLVAFYEGFAKSDKAITFYSMGVNQSSSGVDKANAIINCHLASGKLGKVGCGPFSITGQPNAMGGREVGGLANMLAAHMDITNPSHRALVQDFWKSPRIPEQNGLKAVDLFEKIYSGEVKAVWIMATNPLVSMPNRSKIEAALKKCEFVVVSDVVQNNDTLQYADVCLPATAWSEKDGTVTNSERRISRQKGIMPPPGKAKHDWQIMCDVAKAMGFERGFDFAHPSQIFDEHARLSGYQNEGRRDFDISGLANLSAKQYDELTPIQWPVNRANPAGTARMFTDKRFFTVSKKAQFIPITPRLPEQQTDQEYPLVLNTGRLRDQWHTMTRTGKAASLSEHISEPFVDIHPKTAARLQISELDVVKLTSKQSALPVFVRAKINDAQAINALFAPIHWSKTNSSSATVARLFSDSHDPISGQPELKHAAVKLEKCFYKTQWTVFTHAPLPDVFLQEFIYWSQQTIANGFCYRLASEQDFAELKPTFDLLLSDASEVYRLEKGHAYQLSSTIDETLVLSAFGCVSDCQPTVEQDKLNAISVDWVNQLMLKSSVSVEDLRSVLRCEPSEEFTQGKLVCSCFKVRENTIIESIKDGNDTVESLGEDLKCGTNCGSCKSELSSMIQTHCQTIEVHIKE